MPDRPGFEFCLCHGLAMKITSCLTSLSHNVIAGETGDQDHCYSILWTRKPELKKLTELSPCGYE